MDTAVDIPIATPPVARSRARGQFRKSWPWLLGTVLLVAAGAGLWIWKGTSSIAGSSPVAARGGRHADVGNGAQPVSVQAVRRREIRVGVNAIGSIAASNTAIVRAQVSGVLQAIDFREGQQVKAGQELARIDPRAFEAALAQAEGALARDKSQLEGARVDLARYTDLLAKDAIPKQQLDTQVALVGQLEGTVKVDQAAVQTARLQLSYTRVSAPIGGRVGLKQADLGNVVQPTDANGIVIVTQTRPIALTFAVPAANLPIITARLNASQPLPVEAWDRGGKNRLALGRVATTDNAIDPTTDTIKVKALFPNEDDALFPNQAVDVRLQLDSLPDALAVPQTAVLTGSQGSYVYVVGGGNAVSTRPVTPGPVDGGWMAVEGPLAVGDQVVIDGVDRLRDGARVEVIVPDAKPSAGKPAQHARSGRAP